MKAKSTLLVILGLASSAIMAQSSQPQMESGSQPQSGAPVQPGYPAQQSQPGSQSTTPSDAQSSGSSDQSQSGMQSQGASGSEPAMPSTGQTEMQTLPAPAPMTQLEPKTENGFTYLCGGVGAEEAAQLKQAARDYDMMLTFATRKGNYLADVNVDIQDARGNLALKATCDGPIMLLDVPKSGTYKVHAETGGYSLNKIVRVQAKGRSHASLVLTWPQQVAEATTEAAPTSSGDSSGNGASSGNNGTR